MLTTNRLHRVAGLSWFALGSLLLTPESTSAQTPVCNPSGMMGYTTGSGTQACPTDSRCMPPFAQSYLSIPASDPYPEAMNYAQPGYPLNLSLWEGLGPADLPPLSNDPVAGSFPFVSRSHAAQSSNSSFPERVTEAGLIDLATGSPLYQAVDFSLPFGSAVFRHIRTYGDNVTNRLENSLVAEGAGDLIAEPYGAMWDWNGMNWMMTDNPILLLDATYTGIFHPSKDTDFNPICYLILDAHHTVPFKHYTSNNSYVAPPQFDARMSQDSSDPNTYHVWLQQGELHYTFTIPPHGKEDVSTYTINNTAVSGHTPLASGGSGGPGVPYYALLQKIEDRYHNAAVMYYCNSGNNHVERDSPYTSGFVECCQDCNTKGQLLAIKLFPAATPSTATWTILYLHREFIPAAVHNSCSEQVNQAYGYIHGVEVGTHWDQMAALPYYIQHCVSSIYAYKQDLNLSGFSGLTIPATAFYGNTVTANSSTCPYATPPVQSFDDYESVDEAAASSLGVPGDWDIRTRYIYEEPVHRYYKCAPTDSQYFRAYDSDVVGYLAKYGRYNDQHDHEINFGLNLLKASTTRRDLDRGSEVTTNEMYRYFETHDMNLSENDDASFGSGLRMVLSDKNINAIVRAKNEVASSGGEGNSVQPLFTVNDVLGLANDALIPITKDGWSQVPLYGVADIYMRSHSYYEDLYTEPGSSNYSYMESMRTSLGLDSANTGYSAMGRAMLADHRKGDRYLRVWRFKHYPEQDASSILSGAEAWDMHALSLSQVHYPYRYLFPNGTGSYWDSQDLRPVALDQAFYITVVDEWKPPILGYSSDGLPQYDYAIYPSNVDTGNPSRLFLKKRHAVGLNIAGLVVWDRSWSFETDANGTLIDASGFHEEVSLDNKNRVKERRTIGWSAPTNPDPTQNGLVYHYTYDDDQNDPNLVGPLQSIGISKGSNPTSQPTIYYLEKFTKDSQRPDLIASDAKFDQVSTDMNASTPDLSTTTFSYYSGDEQSVETKTVLMPAVRRSSSSSTLYSAVEKNHYDSHGNLDWSGVGLVATNGAMLEFFPTYRHYNDCGQVDQQIEDFDQTGQGVPTPPTGFARVVPDPSSNPALNYTTTYAYSSTYGLIETDYPNGRHQYIAYVVDQNDAGGIYQWIYSDVITDGGCKPLSPVQVNHIVDGKLVETKKIKIAATHDCPPSGNETYAASDVLSVTTPSYNANGQLVGMKASGEDGSLLSADIQYDSSGQVDRQVAPDHTITRYTYDPLGRLDKTYRGTQDTHEYWQTAPPPADPSNPSYPNDNMTLIENRSYGVGVTDANQLSQVRHYRDQPNNQYAMKDQNGNWIGGPPDEESVGWIDTHLYDWRMREVRVDRDYHDDLGGLKHTYSTTWLDNQGRLVMSAQYDSAPLSTVDPQNGSPGVNPPTASTVLNATPRPLALVEYVYDASGSSIETRNYAVSGSNLGSYTATVNYFDYAGRIIETVAPNSPRQTHIYDGRGREIQSSSWAGAYEIERTATSYDADNHAFAVTRYERLNGAAETTLTSSNSVCTYTYSWYDIPGKLVASINYGTADLGHKFISNTSPPSYGSTPNPAVIDTNTGAVIGFSLDSNSQAHGGLCTAYNYDSANRQNAIFHPDGSVTRYEFDDLGRQRLVRENADSSDPNQRRLTAYDYDPNTGLLVRVAAVLPAHQAGSVTNWQSIHWPANDGTLQITQILYGAMVVDSTFDQISSNDSLIAEVRYPSRDTGQPDATHYLRFTYYSDGSIASREDALGRKFSYKYNEIGQLIDLAVSGYAAYDASGTIPPRRIDHITFGYDGEGKPLATTAYWTNGTLHPVVSDSLIAYDGFDNMLSEKQLHDALVSSTSNPPTVDYTWSFASYSGGNSNRLLSITYPQRKSDGSRRMITMNYGAATGDLDDALNRVTRIKDQTSTAYASYAYAGGSRRIWSGMGAGTSDLATQTFGATSVAGYPGLDQFGRIIDLHYQLASDNRTIHRYQYAYDVSGNRLHTRTTQWPITPSSGSIVTHDNDRSYWYGYDALQRLVESKLGSLATDNSDILSSPIPRVSQWSLDNLGNWNGVAQSTVGLADSGDFDGDGHVDARTINHDTNRTNEIESIDKTLALYGQSSQQSTTTYVSDAVGNLVCDGVYYYQYDAWNRLMQVSLATHNQSTGGNSPETNDPSQPWFAGKLVARYAYDSAGRLTSKWTPLDPSNTSSHPAESDLRREDYYYDGVRRIQEAVYRPLGAIIVSGGGEIGEGGEEGGSGEEGGGQSGGEPPPGAEEPFEEVPMDPFDPGTLVILYDANWEAREYVWGPDYVDECVFQIDRAGRVLFTLNDANHNVMALLAGPGFTSSGTNPHVSSANWPVLEQYVWSPYGELLAKDTLALPAGGGPIPAGQTAPYGYEKLWNRLGHQGLVFERFDAAITEPPLAPTDVVAGTARGLYQNRNRWYDASSGRFTTADLNESAAVVLSALAMNAHAISTFLTEFDAVEHYADGLSRFSYQRSNPLHRLDPTGLNALDDDVDEWMNDRAGNAMATLGVLADHAGLGLSVAVGILSSFIPGAGIYDAYKAGVGICNGTATFWDYVALGAVALPVAGKLVGAAYRWGKEIYAAGKAEMKATSKGLQILGQMLCFAGGTTVLLPDGELVPIEALAVGTSVATAPDPTEREGQEITVVPDAWCIVHATLRHGGEIDLLRPRAWMEGLIGSSAEFMLSLPEMGVQDLATIGCIDPCPSQLCGPISGVITARIKRIASDTTEVFLEGSDSPIETTWCHPFWSLSRNCWTAAGNLAVGESVASRAGALAVQSLATRHGIKPVYNIEVGGTHTYFVSNSLVWVHNSYMRIFENRATAVEFLEGKSLAEMESMVNEFKAAGWTVAPLGRGKSMKDGIRIYDGGNKLISWSPGLSGRHGGDAAGTAYWKVSNGVETWRIAAGQ